LNGPIVARNKQGCLSDTEEPIVKVLFAKGWRNQHMKTLVPDKPLLSEYLCAVLWTSPFSKGAQGGVVGFTWNTNDD
jgi:hypothetical protein